MARAICIHCGAEKRAWASRCPTCIFDPRDDKEAMAKSYILSMDRYDVGSDPSEWMGLPEFDEQALDEIGSRIRMGNCYEFRQEDVRLVVEALVVVEEMTWKVSLKAFLAVIWWLAPLWIVIAIGAFLFFWK